MSSIVSSVRSSIASSINGSLDGGGGSVVNSYAEYTADTSATPTTSRMTVGTGKTAAVVWVGANATTALLPHEYFWLYVDVNGTVRKTKAYRWQSYQFKSAAGDVIKVGALAPDDSTGVAISYGIVDGTFITSTTAPSGSTGNANCDHAAPTIWDPVNAHITLTDAGTDILFNDQGADKTFFLSESEDGSTNWTEPVEFRLYNGYTQTFTSRYKCIALMSYTAGQTVNVTCAGTISGAANEFDIASVYPEIAGGDVLSVSSSSDGFGGDQGTAGQNLEYALANAGDWDVILLTETTTYTLSRILFDDSGNSPYDKNLLIVADDGVTPTITGYGCGHPAADNVAIVQGVTFDFASVDVANTDAIGFVHVNAGTLWLHSCTVTGPGSGTAKNLIGVNTTGNLRMFNTTATTAGEDVLNTNLSGTSCETYACTLATPGASGDTNENIYTAHNSSVMVDYGSTMTKNSGGGPAIIHAGTSYIYLFHTRCLKGSASTFDMGSSSSPVRMAHGVYVDVLAPDSTITAIVASDITATSGSVIQKPTGGEYFAGNRFTGGGAATSGNQMFQVRGSCGFEGNLFREFRVAVANSSSFDLNGDSWSIDHCTFTTNNWHLDFQLIDTGTCTVRNNIFENTAGDILCHASATGTIVDNGNIFGFTVDTDYTTRAGSLGASTSNNTTPGINATTKKPTAAGNCDNEGTVTGLAWFGGIGPDLIPLSHSTTERPRGCFGVADRDIANFVFYGRKR